MLTRIKNTDRAAIDEIVIEALTARISREIEPYLKGIVYEWCHDSAQSYIENLPYDMMSDEELEELCRLDELSTPEELEQDAQENHDRDSKTLVSSLIKHYDEEKEPGLFYESPDSFEVFRQNIEADMPFWLESAFSPAELALVEDELLEVSYKYAEHFLTLTVAQLGEPYDSTDFLRSTTAN
jgi:hypothetical protein